MVLSSGSHGRRMRASLQSGLLARTCTRARTHEFNVPKESDDASAPRHPKPAGADEAAAGASRCGARASTARACSRCGRSPRARRIIEYKGEVISWHEALRRHPHDPAEPNHTFYFHVDDEHVIDGLHEGNAAKWINHSCAPNCEADEIDGRVFIKALRAIRPGEELNYDYGAGARRPPHRQGEEAVRVPLRQRGAAAARCSRRQAMSRPGRRSRAARRRSAMPAAPHGEPRSTALGRRGAAAAPAGAAARHRGRGRRDDRIDQQRSAGARARGAAPAASEGAVQRRRSVESRAFGAPSLRSRACWSPSTRAAAAAARDAPGTRRPALR